MSHLSIHGILGEVERKNKGSLCSHKASARCQRRDESTRGCRETRKGSCQRGCLGVFGKRKGFV